MPEQSEREILSRWCDYKEGRYKDKRVGRYIRTVSEWMGPVDGADIELDVEKRMCTACRPGYMSIDRMKDWTLWSVSLEIS